MRWRTTNLTPEISEYVWSVEKGNVIFDNNEMFLENDSEAMLRLNKGAALIPSNNLKVEVKFKRMFNSYDYESPSVDILIKIHYVNNKKQYVNIPLREGKLVNEYYINESIIAVDMEGILQMDIHVRNTARAGGELVLGSLKILKSEDVNTEQLTEAIEDRTSLRKVNVYNNGCILDWGGEDNSTRLEIVTDVENNFVGILVDYESFIPFQRFNMELPDNIHEGEGIPATQLSEMDLLMTGLSLFGKVDKLNTPNDNIDEMDMDGGLDIVD